MTVATLPRRTRGAALAESWVTTLIDAYGLPEPEAAWVLYKDADWLAWCPGVDEAVLQVRLARRADVAPWAARLGVEPETSKDIHEYDDGSWIAVVSQVASVPGWQPGLKLRVFHTEQRWAR